MKTSAHKEHNPVIIAGLGGSGTRVLAEICQCFGLYLGSDLNRASDNLIYTLLLRRKTWFKKMVRQNRSFSRGLSLHHKMLLGKKQLTLPDLAFLSYAVLDMSLHYRDDWKWPWKRMIAYLKTPAIDLDNFNGWGWKEPNSYLLIRELGDLYPGLKFIHTVRHGLDMAFSGNQRQLRAWGDLYGIPEGTALEGKPSTSLEFWVKANQQILNSGQMLGDDRYLFVSYDQLCQNPREVIDDIISFLEIEPLNKDIEKAAAVPRIPASLGRYKEHDLKIFDPVLLEFVERIGFKIERKRSH
jgi:hypothetical protein